MEHEYASVEYKCVSDRVGHRNYYWCTSWFTELAQHSVGNLPSSASDTSRSRSVTPVTGCKIFQQNIPAGTTEDARISVFDAAHTRATVGAKKPARNVHC